MSKRFKNIAEKLVSKPTVKNKEQIVFYNYPPKDENIEVVKDGWPVVESPGVQMSYRGKMYYISLEENEVVFGISSLSDNGDPNEQIIREVITLKG